MEHLKGRSSSWTPLWDVMLDFALEAYGHLLQWNLKGGNSDLWCHILCFINVKSEVKYFEQDLHLTSGKKKENTSAVYKM